MADPLSTQLQKASFRGVPFHVMGGRLSGGRRVEVHEYPRRDKPYVEDLGRATREFSIRGFLIGADYIAQVKKLLEALEKEGAGTLIHPWHGSLEVCLREPGDVEYSEKLGMATVDMQFVEAGDLAYPSATVATGQQSRLAADQVGAASTNSFSKKFKTDGFPDFVTAAAQGNLSKVLGVAGVSGMPGLAQLGYANNAARALQSLSGLFSSPAALGAGMLSFFGLGDLKFSALNISAAIKSLLQIGRSSSLQSVSYAANSTPSRMQVVDNQNAMNALARQSLLTQAVGLSSLMPATVYEDSVDVRDQLTAALDAESLTASDEVYQALQAARSAVWQDLTERSQDSARLDSYTPPVTTPALVLAYDRYEDADRSDEIVARNRVRHPGFVPPQKLKVLSV